MPRPKKQKVVQSKPVVEEKTEKPTEYEDYLIKKIDKCQRIVSELSKNPIWLEIRQDYETTAKSLDMSWAYEDVTSPRFKQMQAAKMASLTFMNLKENYEHDLKLAQTELTKFQNPKSVVRKDFDEEGILEPEAPTKTESNAYHGQN